MKGILFCLLAVGICANAIAQQAIKGVVKNEEGVPLIGTAIYGADNEVWATTGPGGKFETKILPNGNYTLSLIHLGYEPTVMEVEVGEFNVQLEIVLTPQFIVQPSVIIESVMPTKNAAPTSETFTDVPQSLAQDLPVALNGATSLTFTSDAGNGVGYTGLRIRGMDATRINVTVNGIPINDQESQGVFWVNMPDISSSSQRIQVQRGVGTSTNGGQAFGASVNLETNQFTDQPEAVISSSFGSFNTQKVQASFNTGRLESNWAFEGRLSKIVSDGFIDRASSNLKSYYFGTGYASRKHNLRFTSFSGQERTYQAWYGVGESIIDTNRTYNPYTYENQVDQYQQDHYQLHYDFNPRPDRNNLKFSTAFYYTRGRGFYEEYKEGESFSTYQFKPITIDTVTIDETDVIRRRWLDNHLIGGIYSVKWLNRKYNFQKGGLTNVILGGNYNHYYGGHYGEPIWARFASNTELGHRYYENGAFKRNFNNYVKATYAKGRMALTADMQVRSVHYEFEGISDDLVPIEHSVDFLFFNPKVQASYDFSKSARVYAYWGISNREPVRNDFVEVEPSQWPSHETVNDFELGYTKQTKRSHLSVNGYYMRFKNQLVLNGQINDVGAYLRVNVPESYRAGIEIAASHFLVPERVELSGNLTLSQNKITQFSTFIEQYDENFGFIGQREQEFESTTISFSPSAIGFGKLSLYPLKNLELSWQSKYVGQQYLDNTQNDARSLDAYWVNDLIFNFEVGKTKLFRSLAFNATVFNILNHEYESNGWTWVYDFDGAPSQENAYYPQAGINFMAGLTARF